MIDIQKLKALAEAATPGPWKAVDYGDYRGEGPHWYVDTEDTSNVCFDDSGDPSPNHWDCRGEHDMKYIAAANPAAVLELIAEIERLRDELLAVEPNYSDVKRLCGVLSYLGISTPESEHESAAKWINLVRSLIRSAETSKLLRQDAKKVAEYEALKAQDHGLPPVKNLLPMPSVRVPANCRERLVARGLPHPRSSCEVCGHFSPRWEKCKAELSDEVLHNSVKLEVFEIVCKERDQLKAENESLRQQLAVPSDVLADAEALRKDAERYRFLRDGDDELVAAVAIGKDSITFLGGVHADNAIDAAMSKEAGHE